MASDWVDRYEQDAESAMLELVQYFVLCCGCRGVVTMEMFQEDDTSAIIRKLTENFAEVSNLCLYCFRSHIAVVTGEWRLPTDAEWSHTQEVQGRCGLADGGRGLSMGVVIGQFL